MSHERQHRAASEYRDTGVKIQGKIYNHLHRKCRARSKLTTLYQLQIQLCVLQLIFILVSILLVVDAYSIVPRRSSIIKQSLHCHRKQGWSTTLYSKMALQHDDNHQNDTKTTINHTMIDSSSRSNILSMVSGPQQQLPSHTFAGLVERNLIDRFDPMSIDRVLQSWRLLDQDYIHHEYIGRKVQHPTTGSATASTRIESNEHGNNTTESKAYQLCHSYVPGLTIREFWDTKQYEWCNLLQSNYHTIRNEFLSVISKDISYLQQHGNNIWAQALDSEVASTYGDGWSTLVLMNRGIWDEQNVHLFPITSQILHDINAPTAEIFFASMKPNSYIPYHSDFTNFVLTCHLAIEIPYNGTNQCRLCVGDTQKVWYNGEVTLFDTSIMHDAINESDQTRYILMMRVWHPDLTSIERQALQYIYDVLEFPEIITTTTTTSTNTIEEQQNIEQKLLQIKAFPLQQQQLSLSSKGGFGAVRSNTSKKKGKKGR
jgi:hypothetical protein